jgi:hypothetical protein
MGLEPSKLTGCCAALVKLAVAVKSRVARSTLRVFVIFLFLSLLSEFFTKYLVFSYLVSGQISHFGSSGMHIGLEPSKFTACGLAALENEAVAVKSRVASSTLRVLDIVVPQKVKFEFDLGGRTEIANDCRAICLRMREKYGTKVCRFYRES